MIRRCIKEEAPLAKVILMEVVHLVMLNNLDNLNVLQNHLTKVLQSESTPCKKDIKTLQLKWELLSQKKVI